MIIANILVEAGLADRMKIRIPKIPNYNTAEDCRSTVDVLKKMAEFRQLDVFPYVIRDYHMKE